MKETQTALASKLDVLYGTYYALGNDFGGRPTDKLAADLRRIVDAAAGKPLVLKEFGYPTGASGASKSGQADFIDEAFRVWDSHAGEIPLVFFSRMYDGVRADCEAQAARYGFSGVERFIQFLCTLGLRDDQDRAKPAWDRLEAAARVRGF